MTQLIRLHGTIVAVAGPFRFYLAPDIEARPRDDVRRRTIALMCAYAHAIDTGEIPGPYTDAHAEACAQYVLDQLGLGARAAS